MPYSRRFLPSLIELVAFEASARHGSFTRAAEELGLTQGAVSKQVRQLEQTLGMSLFERVRQRIILTAAGGLYVNEVRETLQRIERSTHSVMAAGGSTGTINFAVLPTFATRWLVGNTAGFTERNPGVAVNFTTRIKRFSFEEEPFDLAVQCGAGIWPGAAARYLFHESVVAVASPDHIRKALLKKPADLLNATLIQQTTRPSEWDEWFASVGIAFKQPPRGPLFDQFAMMTEAAAAGMGVALIPRFLIEAELKSKKLAVLFDHVLPGTRAYYLIIPLAKQRDPLINAFCDWLFDAARETDNVTYIPPV